MSTAEVLIVAGCVFIGFASVMTWVAFVSWALWRHQESSEPQTSIDAEVARLVREHDRRSS